MTEETLLLKISADVARLDERTKIIMESQERFGKKLDDLPCSSQLSRIESIESCQSDIREKQKERTKGNYSIAVAIIALVGTAIMALVQLLR